MIRRAPGACVVALLAGLGPTAARGYELIGVRWTAGSVGFRINPNLPASAGTTAQQIELIRCAASTWRDQSRADFQLDYEGTTSRSGFNERDGINNISHVNTDGGDALAATLINGRNGVASSFDIVFFESSNGITNRWSGPGEPDAGEFDVQGVAAHELGHALGLDHSAVPLATMFASASGRALGMRTLDADDRQGVEALYGLRTQTAPAVQLTSVTPASGPAAGGNEVVIEGANFTHDSDSQLLLDGTVLSGALWNVESCTRIRVLSMPARPPGEVSLRLVNSIGSRTLADAYTYTGAPPAITSVEPAEGPLAGGIAITIEGANFLAGAVFTIGGKPLVDASVLDATTATGTLPPGDAAGPVDVRVVEGELEAVAAGAFTYNPYVLALSDTAAEAGGQPVAVLLRATTPEALAAASFGLVHAPALLAVDRVSVEDTAAAAAELVTVDVDNVVGVTTVEILMDSSGANVFPAGAGLLLARIDVAAAAGAGPGTEIPLQIRDGLGSPAVPLAFRRAVDEATIRPLPHDGKVTVTSIAVSFVRGDANGDGRGDLADAVFLLDYLFKAGRAGPCADAADANDDGELDIADPVAVLLALFRAANPLPAPFPLPGTDPTADALDCAR